MVTVQRKTSWLRRGMKNAKKTGLIIIQQVYRCKKKKIIIKKRGPLKIWYGNIAMITFSYIVNAEQSINVSESFSNNNQSTKSTKC